MDLLVSTRSVEELGHKLVEYYSENWPDVRQRIEAQLATYNIDEEAKATFLEALAAHEVGHYRCVCRVLFPEIERVARVEIHGGSLEAITSQKKLLELAGDLDTFDTQPSGLYAYELYRKLAEHLYQHVNTEEKVRAVEDDPVPMRHAAIHGVITYSTAKNGLNTIFMTDYILQVVHAVKRITAEAEKN